MTQTIGNKVRLRRGEGSLPLRTNFLWTFGGNVLYAACQWGILMALSKLGNAQMVGQFSLGLAIGAPVILFSNLQLRTVQATDVCGDHSFGQYLGLRLGTAIAAGAIIAGIAATGGYSLDTALVIVMVGASKVVEAICDVFYGLLQQHQRMDKVAQSLMLRGIISLAAASSVLYVTRNVLWATFALTVSWLIVLLVVDSRSARLVLRRCGQAPPSLRPEWNLQLLWRLALQTLPLGIAGSLVSLNGNIPRYFLEGSYGESALGVFSAMAYIMVAGNTVIAALAQSAAPVLARHHAEGRRREFLRLLGRLVAMGIAVGAVGILVAHFGGRFLLTLLYTDEYAQHVDVFVWLMIAAAISYVASFFGYAMSAARYFRVQIPQTLAVLMATLGSSLAWIPRYGMRGAALSSVLQAVVQVAGGVVVVWHIIRHMPHWSGAKVETDDG